MSTGTAAASRTFEFLISAEHLGNFVSRWEAGRLPRSEWNHAAHVAVAAYLVVCDRKVAFARMKAGILRHNTAVGTENTATTGYNEEVTRYWIDRISTLLRDYSDPWHGACEAVRVALAERRSQTNA